ncbi:MAG: DUF1269 domain-containing protein [Acidobacteria bacterium]|nr:DUF1269 domain-containing protein [Candidatus Sulfomarinibacter kjeldsenii]
MSVEGYEIMMATYPTEGGAAGAMDILKQMAKDGSVDIVDAAVLSRDGDGEVHVKQESLPSVKKWSKRGAIIGGVIGVIFPPSLIGSALLGAGIGAGSAKIGKESLKSDELWDAAKDLEPGTSVFVAVVEVEWIEQIQKAAAGYSKLAEHALDSDAAASLGIVVEE